MKIFFTLIASLFCCCAFAEEMHTVPISDDLHAKVFCKKQCTGTDFLDGSPGWIAVFDLKTEKELIRVNSDDISERDWNPEKNNGHPAEAVLYRDYNFDGVKDLAIREYFEARGIPTHKVYLADKQNKNKFDYSEAFSQLEEEQFDDRITVDTAKKKLSLFVGGGCCTYIITDYIVQDNKPQPVRATRVDWWHDDKGKNDNLKLVTIEYTPLLLSFVQNMLQGSLNNNEQLIADSQQVIEQMPELALIKEGFENNKRAARAANDKALALLKKHQFNDAVAVFQQAYKFDPSDIEIVNNYGYALIMSGKLDQAKSVLETALAMHPGRASAWFNYAEILALLKKEALAVAAYRNTYRFSKDKVKTVASLKKQAADETDEYICKAITKTLQRIEK